MSAERDDLLERLEQRLARDPRWSAGSVDGQLLIDLRNYLAREEEAL